MRITLREAVAQYKREPGSASNAYDWYRRQAQEDGEISIGEVKITAVKSGQSWTVDSADLDKALAALKKRRTRMKEARVALENGQLLGKPGETVEIEGGSYFVAGKFHFVTNDYLRARGDSDGTWCCNTCKKPASTEHKNDECHRCSDWNGCGRDCTLSKVFCERCETEMAV